MHKVIKIRNLHCAACAAELGEELQEIEGVEEAAVDFINQRVSLTYLSQEAFVLAVESISSFEKVEIIDENAPVRKERHVKELVSIGVSAALFAVALVIFTMWKPWLGIFGSILFAALYLLPNYLDVTFAMRDIIKMLPYVVTVIVLVLTSMRKKRENQPPASLGLNYFREER